MDTPSPPMDGLLTREETAKAFSCSIETIKRLEKKGKLPRVQLGERAVRYRRSDVQRLMSGEKQEAAQ